MKTILLISLTWTLFLTSCEKSTEETHLESVADDISYIVYVRPQDPNDEMQVQYLFGLHKEKLVEDLFSSVYLHQAKVHDFYGNPMTIDDVKTLELSDVRYSRDSISALQFKERWYYDAQAQTFQKKVVSVHVSYTGPRDDNGVILGNYPGFIIEMK